MAEASSWANGKIQKKQKIGFLGFLGFRGFSYFGDFSVLYTIIFVFLFFRSPRQKCGNTKKNRKSRPQFQILASSARFQHLAKARVWASGAVSIPDPAMALDIAIRGCKHPGSRDVGSWDMGIRAVSIPDPGM